MSFYVEYCKKFRLTKVNPLKYHNTIQRLYPYISFNTTGYRHGEMCIAVKYIVGKNQDGDMKRAWRR